MPATISGVSSKGEEENNETNHNITVKRAPNPGILKHQQQCQTIAKKKIFSYHLANDK